MHDSQAYPSARCWEGFTHSPADGMQGTRRYCGMKARHTCMVSIRWHAGHTSTPWHESQTHLHVTVRLARDGGPADSNQRIACAVERLELLEGHTASGVHSAPLVQVQVKSMQAQGGAACRPVGVCVLRVLHDSASSKATQAALCTTCACTQPVGRARLGPHRSVAPAVSFCLVPASPGQRPPWCDPRVPARLHGSCLTDGLA